MTQDWPESPYSVNPPLYLAGTQIKCWKCTALFLAVCLLGADVEWLPGAVTTFSSISSLPEDVISFIQARFPAYKYLSKIDGYGNICPQCQSLAGDHFLISEPDGPFYPMPKDSAQQITLMEIPLSGRIRIQGSAGSGNGELILECTKKAN